MKWCEDFIVIVVGLHLKLNKWLHPPYCEVCHVLSSIRNQLVKEIGHIKFVPYLVWLWDCIILQNSPNDSSHHVMMLTKFWDRYKINCSKKLDTSSSNEVRTVHGVVVGLHSSHVWILLKTHQMTPPLLWYCPSFGSIRNQLVKEIGRIKFIRSSYRTWFGCRIA